MRDCQESFILYVEKIPQCHILAQVIGIPVGQRWRSGGRWAMTLVATMPIIIFFISFFSSIVDFSHRKSAQMKKLI